MITVCFIDTSYRLRYRFFVLFLQLCNLLFMFLIRMFFYCFLINIYNFVTIT